MTLPSVEGEGDSNRPADHSELLQSLCNRTPARLFLGRSGGSYRTSTLLDLREARAAALDAVQTELDLERDLGRDLITRYGLFEVQTCCRTKSEYLLRPDLGRTLGPHTRAEIARRCPSDAEIQIVIGDGLSVAAVARQVPALLPILEAEARRRGLRFGLPFVVRYARVGILNEIGATIHPEVAILLIGERPGLATAESLSAYMAYQPRPGHTDAHRNLVSNIHIETGGVPPDQAALRVMDLAERLIALRASGVGVKEGTIPQRPRTQLGLASPAHKSPS